jgi:hypothetical protein
MCDKLRKVDLTDHLDQKMDEHMDYDIDGHMDVGILSIKSMFNT